MDRDESDRWIFRRRDLKVKFVNEDIFGVSEIRFYRSIGVMRRWGS